MRRAPIVWVESTESLNGSITQPATEASSRSARPRSAIPLAARDEAVFLLHTAAEVEHALLVQYLYAAYSLGETSLRTDLSPTQQVLLAGWQSEIAKVAVEEMAHLITVQNVLLAIGGPVNFDREDYPFRSEYYPFHFSLRPLNKDSLARFIAAEMPDIQQIPANEQSEVRAIVRRGVTGNAGIAINRVGPLYDQIIDLLGTLDPLRDFIFSTATTFQGQPIEWGATPNQTTGRIVWLIDSQTNAQSALSAVQHQGEGPPTGRDADSHFRRFLEIYRIFPETNPRYGHVMRPIPALPVATNANTLPGPSFSTSTERARITDCCTRHWANLFNTRYRMVLFSLQHYLQLPYGTPPNCRSQICGWIRNNMKLRLPPLAKILARKPRKDPNIFIGGRAATAGAPFELPYSLTTPQGALGPWLTQRDMAFASQLAIERIRKCTTDQDELDLLDEITSDDDNIKLISNSQISDPNRPCDGGP